MNTNKFLLGTLAGGVALFILGYLVWGMALMGFMESNAGSATGVMKTDMVWWSLILGNLFWGALLSYIFLKWAGISTFAGGASAGAVLGLLISGGIDFIMYGTSNLMNLTAVIVDIIANIVVMAIVGGVVGLVLGSGKSE
jgi:hypothetical protein